MVRTANIMGDRYGSTPGSTESTVISTPILGSSIGGRNGVAKVISFQEEELPVDEYNWVNGFGREYITLNSSHLLLVCSNQARHLSARMILFSTGLHRSLKLVSSTVNISQGGSR